MTDEVRPPEGDEAQDRHRFYAQVAAAINSNTHALERAFDVIKSLEETLKGHNDLLREMRTTARVLIGLMVFFAGGMGWYINRVVTAADTETAKVEKLDRVVELHDMILKQQQPVTEQLTSLKNRLGRVEDQVETLERKR